MIGRTLVAAAVAALLTAPAAAAQITQQQPQDTAAANARDTARAGAQQMAAGQADTMPMDTTFLAHAVSGNIKEVRLGELATKQAENESVKDFGKRMVEAHRNAYKVSRGIADTLDVGTLDSMMAQDQAVVDRFRSMEGAAFDSAYMRLMVQDHAKEVAEYRNQVQFGENGMIRRYALQTLPVLRDHFELAQRTARDIGVQVQTPLAGEMQPGPNDTTAYMTPGRDTLAPADTSFQQLPPDSADQIPGVMGEPRDTMMQHADTMMQQADTMMQPADSMMPPATPDMAPDTTMQPDTTIMPSRDTTLVPGENVPRQAGTPDAPAVSPPADTTNVSPTPRDSMP